MGQKQKKQQARRKKKQQHRAAKKRKPAPGKKRSKKRGGKKMKSMGKLLKILRSPRIVTTRAYTSPRNSTVYYSKRTVKKPRQTALKRINKKFNKWHQPTTPKQTVRQVRMLEDNNDDPLHRHNNVQNIMRDCPRVAKFVRDEIDDVIEQEMGNAITNASEQFQRRLTQEEKVRIAAEEIETYTDQNQVDERGEPEPDNLTAAMFRDGLPRELREDIRYALFIAAVKRVLTMPSE